MQGLLTLAPDQGGAELLLCTMDGCYCPHGRHHFERITDELRHWIPTEDHYPRLKKDGGKRPGNVRLAHRLCNNLGYALSALPLDKHATALARWRKRYSSEPPVDFDAAVAAQVQWEAYQATRSNRNSLTP